MYFWYISAKAQSTATKMPFIPVQSFPLFPQYLPKFEKRIHLIWTTIKAKLPVLFKLQSIHETIFVYIFPSNNKTTRDKKLINNDPIIVIQVFPSLKFQP